MPVDLPVFNAPAAGFDEPFELLLACHDRVRPVPPARSGWSGKQSAVDRMHSISTSRRVPALTAPTH